MVSVTGYNLLQKYSGVKSNHQKIKELINAPNLVLKNSNIEFKNVGFKYDTTNEKAIKEININIKGNSMAAFVGHSGAGKSTIINLLPRFYDPQDGVIEIDGQNAIVTREIDEGLERIKVSIPFVASCDLRLNEPRYASLPNIMKAKKKPIDTKDASSLGINIEPRIEQIKVEEPPVRQKGIMVSDVAELVQKLKHEAKVI